MPKATKVHNFQLGSVGTNKGDRTYTFKVRSVIPGSKASGRIRGKTEAFNVRCSKGSDKEACVVAKGLMSKARHDMAGIKTDPGSVGFLGTMSGKTYSGRIARRGGKTRTYDKRIKPIVEGLRKLAEKAPPSVAETLKEKAARIAAEEAKASAPRTYRIVETPAVEAKPKRTRKKK